MAVAAAGTVTVFEAPVTTTPWLTADQPEDWETEALCCRMKPAPETGQEIITLVPAAWIANDGATAMAGWGEAAKLRLSMASPCDFPVVAASSQISQSAAPGGQFVIA